MKDKRKYTPSWGTPIRLSLSTNTLNKTLVQLLLQFYASPQSNNFETLLQGGRNKFSSHLGLPFSYVQYIM